MKPLPRATQAVQPFVDNLLSDVEVAARLGLAINTIRNWRAARAGPKFVRLGKRAIRYRQSDIEAFIAGGEGGNP